MMRHELQCAKESMSETPLSETLLTCEMSRRVRSGLPPPYSTAMSSSSGAFSRPRRASAAPFSGRCPAICALGKGRRRVLVVF